MLCACYVRAMCVLCAYNVRFVINCRAFEFFKLLFFSCCRDLRTASILENHDSQFLDGPAGMKNNFIHLDGFERQEHARQTRLEKPYRPD